MLQEYLEVAARRELTQKLARRRPEPPPETAQGAGALGPSASTEPHVAEPERVVTASLRVQDFADGMGRVLAQNDFSKRAEARFQKEALGLPAGLLAGAGKALVKNPGMIGAGVGAVGGAVAGGPDHRISGALGGAALGAGAGHAGVGIGKRVIQRGQSIGQAASNYGTEVSRRVNAGVGRLQQGPKGAGSARPAPAPAAPAAAAASGAPASAPPSYPSAVPTMRGRAPVSAQAAAPSTLQGRPPFDSSFGGGMPTAPAGHVTPVAAGQPRPSLLRQHYNTQDLRGIEGSLNAPAGVGSVTPTMQGRASQMAKSPQQVQSEAVAARNAGRRPRAGTQVLPAMGG